MTSSLRRQDIYGGAILSAISVLVIVESWRMPRDLQNWPAYAGPGVVTGLLGLGLLAMAVALLIRAARKPGSGIGISGAEVGAYLTDPRTRRLAVIALLSVGYLASLGRGIPYSLTTGTFLVLTMLLFRAATWWLILVVGGVVTVALWVVFNRIFLIPLP